MEPINRQQTTTSDVQYKGVQHIPDCGQQLFIISRKGGTLLTINDYIYRSNQRRHGPRSDKIYWECIHNRSKKCRSRIKTIGNDLFVTNDVHNHFSDGRRIEIAKKAEIEFIYSQRGHPLIVLKDYLYRKNRDKYWRCLRSTKFKCRARVIFRPEDSSAKVIGRHTHPEETEKIEWGRGVFSAIKSRSKDSNILPKQRLTVTNFPCHRERIEQQFFDEEIKEEERTLMQHEEYDDNY